MNAAKLAVLLKTLRESHCRSLPGTWKRGKTTHHTINETGYHVAEFRHADDAAFCDLAHNNLIALLDATHQLLNDNLKLKTALANVMAPVENDEDPAETAYWNFDSGRNNPSRTERDVFKAQVRGLMSGLLALRAARCGCASCLEDKKNYGYALNGAECQDSPPATSR